MSGRHSGPEQSRRLPEQPGRLPEQSRRLPNPALALGAIFLAAVVISALLVKVISHPASAVRPAAASAGDPQHVAAAPASTSAASPSRTPSAAAPATAPGRLADPFGAATAAYVGGRSGTVLAAVYDLRTRQTWAMGSGSPQAEASIVKLDILETLLNQRARSGAALSASDSSLGPEHDRGQQQQLRD